MTTMPARMFRYVGTPDILYTLDMQRDLRGLARFDQPTTPSSTRWELLAVQRYLAQPHVVANIAMWNSQVEAWRSGCDTTASCADLPLPWFADADTWGEHGFWMGLVETREMETARWIFSHEGIRLLGETVRVKVNDVALALTTTFDSGAREVMEILLESPVFGEALGHDERQ